MINGFTNWKDATAKFAKHECSDFHKTCAQAQSSTVDVEDMLDKQASTEKKKNHEYLMKVLSMVHFLARQGLALRGNGDECDSNMQQLPLLRSDDFPPIREFMERKQLKFTSHEIQNELHSIVARQVLREIAASLQSAVFYALMVDETTDKANNEQIILVFQWVDDALVAHEEFVGLYLTDSIPSEALVVVIKDTLVRLNLKIEHCRGQGYDAASCMCGTKKGVTKMLLDEETRAVFTHCYAHALNLAVSDCVKQCKVMKMALDVVAEVFKLIKKHLKETLLSIHSRLTLLLKHQGFVSCVQHAGLCKLRLCKV